MIPIAKPWLDNAEVESVRKVLSSGWIAQGSQVEQFEKDFADYTGAQYACAVSSGTAALHLALLAVGVMPGDVVLTVSHSYIATANSVRYCQAEPVFIDIRSKDYNIDPQLLKQCLKNDCENRNGELWYCHADKLAAGESPLVAIKTTGRVAAILVVHQMGFPCNIQEITRLAKKYSLPVVEDAACAIGSKISQDKGTSWENIGLPHGDIACFSFHPRKILTTGEGGMLTTGDTAYYQQIQSMRNQGMDVSAKHRDQSTKIILESYPSLGFNYRMTDLQAAIGITQLKKLEDILKQRNFFAQKYDEIFQDTRFFEAVKKDFVTKPNWQSYPIRILPNTTIDQRGLMQFLLNQNIATRHGIMNAHQEPGYLPQKWYLPVSEKERAQTVLLPIFANVSQKDQNQIFEILASILS